MGANYQPSRSQTMYSDLHGSNVDQEPPMWLQNGAHAFDIPANAEGHTGGCLPYYADPQMYGPALSGINPQQLVNQGETQQRSANTRCEETYFGETSNHMLNGFTTHNSRLEDLPSMRGGYVKEGPSSSMSPRSTIYDPHDVRHGYLDDGSENTEPYNKLLHKCLMDAPNHELQLKDIYDWFRQNTGKGHTPTEKGWQNSIRHNLSMNPAFQKGSRVDPDNPAKNIWSLTSTAIGGQIEPTTRFRNQNKPASQLLRSTRPYRPAALARQISGAKGGRAARRSQRQRGEDPPTGSETNYGDSWYPAPNDEHLVSNRSTPAWSPSPAPLWDPADTQTMLDDQTPSLFTQQQPYYALPSEDNAADGIVSPSLSHYISGYDDRNTFTETNDRSNADALTAYLQNADDTYNTFDPNLDAFDTNQPLASTSPSPQTSLGQPPSLVLDSKSEPDSRIRAMWSSWSHIKNAQLLPLVLVRHDIREDAYTVEISDGANLWLESLNREAIVDRAHALSCSIDPSESDSQLKILLEKIGAGLAGARQVQTSSTHDDPPRTVRIEVKSTLPRPLAPLRWPLNLTLQDPACFREALFLPLLESHIGQQNRYEELIKVIQEKDTAAGKILDKIESKDLDLAMFLPPPAAKRAGRGGSKKAELMKHIKGLQPFDKHNWWDTHQSTPTSANDDGQSKSGTTFNLNRGSHAEALASAIARSRDAKPPTIVSRSDYSRKIENGSTKAGESGTKDRSETNSDESSRQATPNRLRNSPTTPTRTGHPTKQRHVFGHSPTVAEDESTTEEEESPEDCAPETSSTHIGTRREKAGRIGASRSPGASTPAEEVSNVSPPPTTTPKKKLGTIGGNKSPAAPPITQLPISTPKKKLGVIGGKPDPPPPPSPTPTKDPTPTSSPTGPPTRKRLGVIGGPKTQNPNRTTTTEPDRPPEHPAIKSEHEDILVPETQMQPQPGHTDGAETSAQASTEQMREARETSVERAARKREELKRQLGAQAGGNAGKKKRRF
ncbi:MAG: hypothetical protein M1828_003663 [Chrysothrix sp. TS-e1954]|nr:MAG: hypothetical protein M1828_003663 [Chrysothrix sp. TS-e1954]